MLPSRTSQGPNKEFETTIDNPALFQEFSRVLAALEPTLMEPPLPRPEALSFDIFYIQVRDADDYEWSSTGRFEEGESRIPAGAFFTITSISGVTSLEVRVPLPPELTLSGGLTAVGLYDGMANVTNTYGAAAYDVSANTISYTFNLSNPAFLNRPLELLFVPDLTGAPPLTQSGAELIAQMWVNGSLTASSYTARAYPAYPRLSVVTRLQDMNLSPPARMLILENDTDFFYALASVAFPQTPPMGPTPVSISAYGGIVASTADVQAFVDGVDVTSQGTVTLLYGDYPKFSFNAPVDLTGKTLTLRVRMTLDEFQGSARSVYVSGELDMGGYNTSGEGVIAYPTAGPYPPWMVHKRFRSADGMRCDTVYHMANVDEQVITEVALRLPDGQWSISLEETLPVPFVFVTDAEGLPAVRIVDASEDDVTDLFTSTIEMSDDGEVSMRFVSLVPQPLIGQYVMVRIPIKRDPATQLPCVPLENVVVVHYGKAPEITSRAYLLPPCAEFPLPSCCECQPCPQCPPYPPSPPCRKPCKRRARCRCACHARCVWQVTDFCRPL